MKSLRNLIAITSLLSCFTIIACTANKNQVQNSETRNGELEETGTQTQHPEITKTSSGEEMKYQVIIANFSPKSSHTFEVLMDGRLIKSIDVEALDQPSSSPGFMEFPLRLPARIKSLSFRVKTDQLEEDISVDIKNGKYISVIYDNPYFTKRDGKKLIIEQRMTEVVYD